MMQTGVVGLFDGVYVGRGGRGGYGNILVTRIHVLRERSIMLMMIEVECVNDRLRIL